MAAVQTFSLVLSARQPLHTDLESMNLEKIRAFVSVGGVAEMHPRFKRIGTIAHSIFEKNCIDR